jgi:DNA gyrase subunit A
MKLKNESDAVVSVDAVTDDSDLLIVTENGAGKRTKVERFNRIGRGGQGVRGIKLTAKKGGVAAAFMVNLDDEVILISSNGTVMKTEVRSISSQGRDASGVRVMSVGDGEQVAAVAKVLSAEDAE